MSSSPSAVILDDVEVVHYVGNPDKRIGAHGW